MARRGVAMAYDSAKNVTVLHGGVSGNRVFNETWEWNGSFWTQITTTNQPPRLWGHQMVYDSHRKVIVLFGGADTSGEFTNQTWEYDGTWRQINAECSPAQCSVTDNAFFGMTYDPINRQVVRFGGRSSDGSNQLTWIYDGATWTKLSAAGSPVARVGNAMTYSRRQGRVVMHGGFDASTLVILNDTWLWDGSVSRWEEARVPNPPRPRYDHGMGYHEVTGETIVIGSNTEDPEAADDAFAYDGTRWLPISESSSPLGRKEASMSRAPDGNILLFGGEAPNTDILRDTWIFSGRRWVEGPPASVPRKAATAVYDSARDRVLLFGGESNFSFLNSLEVYDGDSWSIVPTSNPPPARHLHSMAYDSVQDRFVLFGGENESLDILNDTWVFNPNTNVWTSVPTPAALTPRGGMTMTFNENTENIIMFGGYGANGVDLNETWRFNVATLTWRRATPLRAPAERRFGYMTFDSDRNRVVLYGGAPQVAGRTFSDTWEWDGGDWEEVQPSVRPTPFESHGVAWGGHPSSVVAFGGSFGETWRKRNPDLIRPGARFRFDWTSAQVPSSAITNIEFMMLAGATGGAQMEYWDPNEGQWISLALGSGTPGSSGPVVGRLLGAQAQSLTEFLDSMSFRIKAVTPLGVLAEPPSLLFDDVELRVDYSLP
ncbi:MAG: kelch repeat-containing protein [Myxococcota bacterium]